MFIILVANLTDSQKDFIENIFNKNHQRFVRVANSILKSPYDAEDAVSEAFIIIIKYVDRIASLSKQDAIAYCITVVKNISYRMKNLAGKLETCEINEEITDKYSTESAEETVLLHIEENELISMLNILSRAEYLIISMRYLNKFSYSEISEMLEISEEAARKRCQRGLEKVRALMKGGKIYGIL